MQDGVVDSAGPSLPERQPDQAPWGNAARAGSILPEPADGGLLGWLSSWGDEEEVEEQVVCEEEARVVEGAGGYLYEQHPDGSIRILEGPTSAGVRVERGPAHAAITAEIGPHPGATCEEEVEEGVEEAAECADEEEDRTPFDIPWSLATGDIGWIQGRVDALTDLAQGGGDACEADREFLRDLYWWIGVGGYGKGLPEAARLQHHYLKGSGEELEIDSEVYEQSAIVQYAMGELKRVMAPQLAQSGAVEVCSTEVLGRTHLGDQDRLGDIVAGGYLLAEQDNIRLKYANNRFALCASAEAREGWLPWQPDEYVRIEWRVDDGWEFASFAEQAARGRNDVSVIPLPGGATLRLHDGLSAWLVDQDVAASFAYTASWTERWQPGEGP